MTIHLLPPSAPGGGPAHPADPVDTAVPADSAEASGGEPGLDPFWAAVRRRRPDLPLVLLADDDDDDAGTGTGTGTGTGSERGVGR